MQAGQVGERHADVHVVGQVPAGVERHHPEPGPETLADMVGGQSSVGGLLHSAVLGNGPKPVDDSPAGHPGRQPQQGPHQRVAGERERREQGQLPHGDPQGDGAGLRGAEGEQEALRFFHPELPRASLVSLRRHDADGTGYPEYNARSGSFGPNSSL